MKRIFSILVLILLVGCKELEEENKARYTQVTVIDNFEVIYQKAGFLKIKNCVKNDGFYHFQSFSPKGDFEFAIQKGQYATIIIEECIEGQEPLYDEVGLKYYEEQKSAEEYE